MDDPRIWRLESSALGDPVDLPDVIDVGDLERRCADARGKAARAHWGADIVVLDSAPARTEVLSEADRRATVVACSLGGVLMVLLVLGLWLLPAPVGG